MPNATVPAAIYSILSSDTTLMSLVGGVYRNIGPKSATYPFVVYQHISSNDTYTLTQRVSEPARYQIKVIDKGYSAVNAKTALTRIDALLTDQDLDVSGKETWVVRRRGEFEYVQMGEFGVVYQHVGANWMIEMGS